MTWRQALRAILRSFILEAETAQVVIDLVTNGLTPADEVIVNAFLDTTMP
jgi:hypothetical protein